MSKSFDRSLRKGSDPLIIGNSKLASDSDNNLSILDSNDAPKKLIASELEIGDSSNKIIIKKGSDNKVSFQTQASGSEPEDSGGAGLTIQEEGSDLSTTATTLNFVGDAVTASGTGSTKTITVSASSGGGVTVFADISAMTSASASAGNQAFVTANSGLYVHNGGGWYKVATVNTNPTISSPSSGTSYFLNTDGSTATAIELVGADVDEGTTLQNSYAVTTGSLTNGGGTTATITSSATADGTFSALSPSTNTTNRFFKITGNSNSSFAGSFSLTFSMSDGISVATTVQNFSLTFFTQMYVPSGTTLLLGMSFDSSGIGKSGSYGTPTTVGSGVESFYTSGGYNSTMAGHAGYPSATRANNGYSISEISSVNATKGKTIICWYKGSQSINGGSYSVGVPILSVYSNTWGGFGINNGKIASFDGSNLYRTEGSTNVADDNWHCLAWVHSDGTHSRLSNNQIGMYVDGAYETHHALSVGLNYFKANEVFIGYSSDNAWRPPTRVDAFQIFDDELTDAQILSIYEGG